METFGGSRQGSTAQDIIKNIKLNLTMDNAIQIDILPHYSSNTKNGVIRCPGIKYVLIIKY